MKYNKRLDFGRVLVFTIFLTLTSCAVNYENRASNQINPGATITPETVTGPDINNGDRRVVVATGTQVNDVRNINGRVTVEAGASARNIRTYNGRIIIEGNGFVSGNVDTYNGGIRAIGGGEIKGNAEAFNGDIVLAHMTVGQNVQTANGRIDLSNVAIGENVETNGGDVMLENSIVEKDLIIHKRKGFNFFELPVFRQKVVIGPESQIKGSLMVRRKVQLYVHETARINNIVGANAISYSGLQP